MRSTFAFVAAFLASTVTAQEACPPLHFVYARATTEPPMGISPQGTAAQFEAAANRVWSKGYGAAGYSIFTNITALIPGATGWPVHYPASFTGCASENAGIQDYMARLKDVAARCPNTKFALGGHSQGGVVTVRTIPDIPADIQSRIIAITMVGSPQCPVSVKSKCKSYCNTGDAICAGGSSPKASGLCAGKTTRSLFDRGVEAAEEYNAMKSSVVTESPKVFERRMEEAKAHAARAYAADCQGVDVEAEQGHKATGGMGAHMAYNADGYYVKAAACYVLKKFSAGAA